jgi:uncharacterized membrane protein YsdA (DUF1294 family)
MAGAFFGRGVLPSFIAFTMYWLDKSAARNARWRISERTLQVVGLLGGWPGSVMAVYVFRHKSRKVSFQRGLWATALVNCAALLWLGTRTG